MVKQYCNDINYSRIFCVKAMVFCCVVKCENNGLRDRVHFYRIPAELHFKHKVKLNELSAKRRQKWIQAIKREDLTGSKLKYAFVCSRHFLTGKPAELTEVDNPDWVPSIEMGYGDSNMVLQKAHKAVSRKGRAERRDQSKAVFEHGNVEEASVSHMAELSTEHSEGHFGNANRKGCQTDLVAEEISDMILSLQLTNKLQRKLNRIEINYDSFKNDNTKTKYYTGFNSFKKLELVFKLLERNIPVHHNTTLSAFQQFLLTLIKLRLNLDFKDLAYRIDISPTTASTYFKTVIEIMYLLFQNFIVWPERCVLQKTMPSCFSQSFGNKISVIVDCFELYIEKPSHLLEASQCWSQYKHHHTLKYMIGITPQGTVCFISEAWGGRSSDKHITENSGFLENILSGDVILADRGFLIREYVQILGAKVLIPAFTKGKKQLHPIEIEETRRISHVRIHVERVIGLIKQKYTILTDSMPISLISVGEDYPIVDKIVTVCCVLINLCPPIVPF